MKKRTYRKVSIKSVSVEQVLQKLGAHRRLVLAVDVAKTDMVAALWDPAAEREHRALFTVCWKQPQEQEAVKQLVVRLQQRSVVVEAAMEPSGTYGDALRAMLAGVGIEVYRISTHRSHRAAEVYDGVPSLHDAKSAHIVAQLHQDGLSQRWSMPNEQERALSCAVAMMDLYKGERQREINRLEAILSRHWPELLMLMELGTATQLALLSEVGGAAQVAEQPELTLQVLERKSQGKLKPHVAQAVLASACSTVGIGLIAIELEMLRSLAAKALATLASLQQAVRKLRALSKRDTQASAMATTVGVATAAVLVHDIGSPEQFPSARAYLKAAGLNLREKSSGKYQGQLKLTKRGPSRARRYLWLAVLRLLQSDPVVRAYYAQKVARSGGRKSKAVVAVMRKLAKGLHACARSGTPFDSSKLFDVSRLALS